MTVDDLERAQTVYEPLTQSVRRLIDTTIRTEVDTDTLTRAQGLIDEAARLLSGEVMPGSFGVRHTTDGRSFAWGNLAVGLRNPIAPPLLIHQDPTGSTRCDVDLGAAYEGPPGCVHGGMCALILDHMLGATAHRPGEPAFTGTITFRYLQPTRLGRLHATAWVDHHDRGKTYAIGHLADANGVTVEAEGVFIRPRPTTTHG
ncbi:MAG TPA: PaaI family thioesterase [Mycobacterium sp.]|nr:PaaI family thioesterase [Mycobacterium sp.]